MPEQRLTLADLPDTGLGEPRRSEWEEEGLARKSKVAQLCPTLFDPMDYSSPGTSVHGLLQARIQEWVAIPFSMGSSQPRDRAQVSCIAGRFFTV